MQAGSLQQGRGCGALLALEGHGTRVVADDLAVGGGWPLHAPTAPEACSANARVAAGGTGAPQHGTVREVAVEDGPIWGCTHRLAVQLQLLLRVPELQAAGPLVGWGLFPVRQGDGGGQVDVMLQIGVGGLEALETVALGKRGHGQAVSGPWRGEGWRLEGQSRRELRGAWMMGREA